MIKLTLTDSNNTFVWVNPHLIRFCVQNDGDNARVVFGPGGDFFYVKEDVHHVVAEIERATKGKTE